MSLQVSVCRISVFPWRRTPVGTCATRISEGPGRPCHCSAPPFPSRRRGPNARPSGDPRLSIAERYASKEDYLRQVQQAAKALVEQGYLLAEDLPTVTEQASQRYDLFKSRVSV